MRFRTFILFILLMSQPLAAFSMNCGMPMHDTTAAATVSDEHCGGHANTADDSMNGQEQLPDQHPASHATAGGHCQFCAAGAFLPQAASQGESEPLFTSVARPVADHAPQFQSGPLFRPPIF
jgi:hypothetical protein